MRQRRGELPLYHPQRGGLAAGRARAQLHRPEARQPAVPHRHAAEGGDLDSFCRTTRAKSEAQQTFLDQSGELDDLIYFSCTPWFDLTGCTNERDFDKDDNIPRITWGKYVPADGRETLGMCLEVNHRFVDGWHLGSFTSTCSRPLMH